MVKECMADSGRILSADEALVLTEHPSLLMLDDVTSLGAGAAQQLGRHSGAISLAGLHELSPQDARFLGRHCDSLILDGITSLCAAAAKGLGGHRGSLSLGGISTITPKAARGIASLRGELWLNGLTSLDADTAAALALVRGSLRIDGLCAVEDHVIESLADHRGPLSLRGLRSLSAVAGRALSRHQGSLFLDGLTDISAETALALSGHRGDLSCRGIRTITAEVARALAGCEGNLRLDGLHALSVEAAEAMSHHRGWLSLNGITAIDAAACRALVRHPGWLSLTGLTAASADVVAMLRDRGRVKLPASLTADPKVFRQPTPEVVRPAAAGEQTLGVAIIGTGFSGLGMAIGLLKEGRHDFAIFEKAESLGGTWRDNTYPGCACDIPSHLYSFSFAPSADWSKRYAEQPEILAYLNTVSRTHALERFIQFNTTIAALDWDDEQRLWRLTAADGRTFKARVVVAGVGGIHVPSMPVILGLETFAGPVFHTARWRHDVDLTGRRVAVIGTGASSIQVVPELAKHAERVMVFQRTPAWVLPRRDPAFSTKAKWAARNVPGWRRLVRLFEYVKAEVRAIPLFVNPRLMVHGQRSTDKFLKRCIKERQIRRKLVPRYTMGCKRILSSNDYYPALAQEHVEVVMEPIHEIRPWSVLTGDGIDREVDAIVLATGFKPFNMTEGIAISGGNGTQLAEVWRDGPEGFRGVAAAGFPNLFMLMGPNTALAHNSIVVMIEAQVKYILQCLAWLRDGRLDTVEVRPDAQRRYNEELEKRFERTIWSDREKTPDRGRPLIPCSTWYRHASGKNHVLWPGSSLAYRAMMRRADIRDFVAHHTAPARPCLTDSCDRKSAA
jgi:cation diffusion facilitator CzcD-associated flavoprotein CzcO